VGDPAAKEDLEAFRDRVKERLKELGLSARSVEEDMDLTRGTLTRIYGGRKTLDVEMLARLAFRLQVDPLILVGDTGLEVLVPSLASLPPPQPGPEPSDSGVDVLQPPEGLDDLVALTLPQYLTAPALQPREVPPPVPASKVALPLTFGAPDEPPATEEQPAVPPVRWAPDPMADERDWRLPFAQSCLLTFLIGGLVGYATAPDGPVFPDREDTLSGVVVESFLFVDEP